MDVGHSVDDSVIQRGAAQAAGYGVRQAGRVAQVRRHGVVCVQNGFLSGGCDNVFRSDAPPTLETI